MELFFLIKKYSLALGRPIKCYNRKFNNIPQYPNLAENLKVYKINHL